MSRQTQLERIKPYLFADLETARAVLTPSDLDVKQRLMLCVTRKLDRPLTSDRDLVDYLMSGCAGMTAPVSRSQAYRDVAAVSALTGDIQPAAKNWMRHMIVEGAKAVYDMAMTNKDAKGAAAALDKIGKYTRCDKDDETMDWSEMLPPIFEPTDDVTLIEGLDVIGHRDLEKERKRLRELFGRLSDIEDTEPVTDTDADGGHTETEEG